MSARKVKLDRLFRCPVCFAEERQPRAQSVSHECPVRLRQPIPQKGKRRLTTWVDFERIEEDS